MTKLFIYLQLLDLLTTMVVLRLPGGYEANPVVAHLMSVAGVFGALLIVKLSIVGVILLAERYGKTWAITKGAYVYAAVVVWNLVAILTTPPAAA